MKIGIITAYNAYNYGAILQAIALKKTLQKIGHSVRFIETYTTMESAKQYFYAVKTKEHNDWKFVLRKYKLFSKIHKKFNPIPIKRITYNTFDIVIIGSDELWNLHTPISKKPLHTKEIFYGGTIKCNHIITYAVSCGNTQMYEYNRYPNIIKNMKKLNLIMVRDSITQKNVYQLLGKTSNIVMDPTFLIDVKELYKSSNYISIPYILIYAYSIPDKIKTYIKKYSEENNLKIVSVGIKYNWVHENILCSPLQFNDIISKAKAVVTTTFHGTIFSILNHKKFVSLPVSPKTKEILSILDLESLALNDKCNYNEFKNKISKNINYYALENKIKIYKNDSMKKLIEALNIFDF